MTWPFKRKRKDERRLPENAEVRRQFDAQRKSFVSARAQLADEQTSENASRIAQVEAAVRSLKARLNS
jgi:hypothetical protein